MKAATVRQLKDELVHRSPKEILDICLRLAKFKKENKELLTYLLFEASDEASYIRAIREEIDDAFEALNRTNYYLIKKRIRKILRDTKKHIRYSQNKETEVDLLIYFCKKMNQVSPSIHRSLMLSNVYRRQIDLIKKRMLTLHEDLQFDYNLMLDEIQQNQ